MSTLLSVENLSVGFPLSGGLLDMLLPGKGRMLNILEDVSLQLRRGETLGLVGESGSGKTTLARAVVGLVRKTGGHVTFDGRALERPSDFRAIRREAAMMFQDPVASLSPRLKVKTLLAEPYRIHGVALPRSAGAAAAELLRLVGLPEGMAGRYPHELSGGQARRVGVARALALRPKLVLADEPTAGLDVSVQGEILNLMGRLKAELALSYVIVTHNLAMIRHVSDRLAIMYLGRLVETGDTGEVFRRPAHPYTRALLEAEPVPDPRRRREDLAIRGEVPSVLNRPRGCEFHTRCPVVRDICRSAPPAVRESGGRTVRCHFPLA